MTTDNIAAAVERCADGEPIEAVKFTAEDAWRDGPQYPKGVLSWGEARPLLDVEFDHGGWDGPTAPYFIAWTRNRVIWTDEYDSSTSISALPRHPERIES